MLHLNKLNIKSRKGMRSNAATAPATVDTDEGAVPLDINQGRALLGRSVSQDILRD
jgi:hypothetical protein